MKLCKTHYFGDITGYELDYGYIGKPFMTTIFYSIGNILVDTGLSHMRKEVLELVRSKSIACVLLTHHHEDHSGNVAAIMKEKQIPDTAIPRPLKKCATVSTSVCISIGCGARRGKRISRPCLMLLIRENFH